MAGPTDTRDPSGWPASALRLASALQERTRFTTLAGGVPALLAHPDWRSRRPLVLWMHGRTSRKEIDSGRYLRYVRAGIAACAIDLPGHGDRYDASCQQPEGTLGMLERARGEVDGVLAELLGGEHAGMFDADRLAIGGMSAGGMVALRRLCEPHRFRCAAVEATTGCLETLYFPPEDQPRRWPTLHDRDRVRVVDPRAHLGGFEPLPLLAMHSEADAIVPFESQAGFVRDLRTHYEARSAAASLVEFVHWSETGADSEHMGFGRHAHEAKLRHVEFLVGHLDAASGAEA
ncbi:MAG: prolyl oligopeptidase family serine peptidase [Planctomycetota bacterium]